VLRYEAPEAANLRIGSVDAGSWAARIKENMTEHELQWQD